MGSLGKGPRALTKIKAPGVREECGGHPLGACSLHPQRNTTIPPQAKASPSEVT